MFNNWRAPSCGLWILLFVGSLAGLIDIPGATFMEMGYAWQWFCIVALAALKAGIIWGLTPLFERNRWTRWLWCIIICFYLLLCFINGLSFIIFGIGISHKMVNLILQTNPREAYEAFSVFIDQTSRLFLKWSFWIVLFAIAGTQYILRFLSKRWLTCFVTFGCIIGLIPLCFIIPSLEVGRNSFFPIIRTIKDIHETISTERQFQATMNQRSLLPYANTISSSHLANDIVVIIGESASRDCLSLYGFPLPTSPQLDAMSDSLMVFTDAVSPALFTGQVMECLLSFKSDIPGQKPWFHYAMIFDVMNNADYTSWWLSNQERTGKFSNSSAAMVSSASHTTYLSGDNGEDHLLRRYDEELIPLFREAINDSSEYKFIGMQLMGSHLKYSLRYPPSRNKITDNEILLSANKPWMTRDKANDLASYANSLAYTDSILGEIINFVANSDKPTVVIYLSDHGEDVWWHHDWSKRDETSADVPFIIYANPPYRKTNQDIIRQIENALHLPFSTSTLPEMILSLTGTSYKAYNSKRDPLSVDFKPSERYVDCESYQLNSSRGQMESCDSQVH